MLLEEKELNEIIEYLEDDDAKFGLMNYSSGNYYTLENSYDETTLIAEFANRFQSNLPKDIDFEFALKIFDIYENKVLSDMCFNEEDFSIV